MVEVELADLAVVAETATPNYQPKSRSDRLFSCTEAQRNCHFPSPGRQSGYFLRMLLISVEIKIITLFQFQQSMVDGCCY